MLNFFLIQNLFCDGIIHMRPNTAAQPCAAFMQHHLTVWVLQGEKTGLCWSLHGPLQMQYHTSVSVSMVMRMDV